jgi:epsin
MPAAAQDPTLANKEGDVFDEFDPRGSFAGATPPASTGAEMDLLSSLSDSFESNQMALVPATTTIPETDTFSIASAGQTNFSSFSASSVPNQQPFDDPFGDGPFRAISPATSSHTVNVHSSSSFQSTSTSQNSEPQKIDTNNNPTFGSAEAYTAGPYATSAGNAHQKVVPSPQYSHQEPSNPNIDILADIFPPSLPQTSTSFQSQSTLQPGFPSQISQQQQHYPGQMGQVPGFHPQSHPVFPAGYPSQNMSQPVGFHAQPGQQNPNYFGNFEGGSYGPSPPSGSHMHHTSAPAGAALAQHNSTSSFILQSTSSHVPANSNSSLALVPQQLPAQEKFETKSTVWADTLNRGLVNLNISGPKTNPLADIGVDFDSINRREKRMEKLSSTPVISNITMGKAMGSGSGMGRAGAGALRSAPRPNHMMGGTMGGGYAVNTPLHQQHMIGNMGMMNNMGNMVQQEGFPMHQQQPPPVEFPPRGYNPMAGAGGGFSQPYGGYPR